MSKQEQIQERKTYWKERKNDFEILLENWLKHEKASLRVASDIIYDAYLRSIGSLELSEFKYGKDVQKWFDKDLALKKYIQDQ